MKNMTKNTWDSVTFSKVAGFSFSLISTKMTVSFSERGISGTNENPWSGINEIEIMNENNCTDLLLLLNIIRV